MTDLVNKIDETFNFNASTIRVIGNHEEPWLVAKDICDILGLKNITNALLNIPDKQRSLIRLNSLGGNQNFIIISEQAVYKLIMRSNKPIAQPFQDYVCEEILPSIRRTGQYKLDELYKQLEAKNNQLEAKNNQLEAKNKESDELIQQLDEKDEELEKSQQEVKKLEKKYIRKSKLKTSEKNVVYLVSSEESEKIREYVVGKSIDLSNRIKGYDSNKLHNFNVVYSRACSGVRTMDIVESMILSKLSKYRCKAGRDVFLLPEYMDIKLFTNTIDDCVNFLDCDDKGVIYPSKTIDKDDVQEKKKEYYEENKEQLKEKNKEYMEENKEILPDVIAE